MSPGVCNGYQQTFFQELTKKGLGFNFLHRCLPTQFENIQKNTWCLAQFLSGVAKKELNIFIKAL